MHFFNPVPVMKLVEVIRGLATSEETFSSVRDLAVKLAAKPRSRSMMRRDLFRTAC